MAIFHELPSELRAAISDTIIAVQRFSDTEQYLLRNSRVGNFFGSCGNSVGTAAETAVLWEDDTENGFVCVDLDPNTQERIAVAANSRAAEILGLRRAELLECFERNDVPFPLAPLDAVRCFLGSLLRARDRAATLHYRILVDGGRGAALVRVSSIKTFNACGQLCQVACTLHSAMMSQARVCAAFDKRHRDAGALGARRSGRASASSTRASTTPPSASP